jgi:predicted RNase H-like HicB family nuclease
MVEAMKSYTVTYERDQDGWWVASVQGVSGVHTQGRTIGDARHRIREALALAIGDRAAERAELKSDVRLPVEAQKKVNAVLKARKRAEAERAKAQESIADVVRCFKKLRLSMRDAGELLGLSHQRVQQIVQKAEA